MDLAYEVFDPLGPLTGGDDPAPQPEVLKFVNDAGRVGNDAVGHRLGGPAGADECNGFQRNSITVMRGWTG